MTGRIYIAFCRTSKRAYIGQTIQPLQVRRQQHEYEALARKSDGCKKFYRALRKHGCSAFDWNVLADNIPIDELDRQEAKFIAEHDCVDHGYNICREGTTTRGLKLSPETRRRMSEAKRPPKSAEHRAKLGAARRGMKFPLEWCRRIGDSKRGITWNPEVIARRVAKTSKRWEFNGESLTLREWSAKTGINLATLRSRVRNGCEPDRLFSPPCSYQLYRIDR